MVHLLDAEKLLLLHLYSHHLVLGQELRPAHLFLIRVQELGSLRLLLEQGAV